MGNIRLTLRRASALDPAFYIETLKLAWERPDEQVYAWGDSLWPRIPISVIETTGPDRERFHTVVSRRIDCLPESDSTHVVKGRGLVAGAALAVAAPFAFVGTVSLLGFGSGGIVAGSTAAGMMSAEAAAAGGGIAAGGTVATLQSIGAAGLGITGTAGAASVGGLCGGAIGSIANSRSVCASSNPGGRWTVMVEEWFSRGVSTYMFVDKDRAREFFDKKWTCGRILVNPLGQEVSSGVFIGEANGALGRVRAAWERCCDPGSVRATVQL